MLACLAQFGVVATETGDGMMITGGQRIRGGGRVNSFGDHRIAMAGSVLALHADAPVEIIGVDCIRTSYPSFWTHFEHLVGG